MVGTTTLGILGVVPRLDGYLSCVEGALDEGGDTVELEPALCRLPGTGIRDVATLLAPEAGIEAETEVI